MSDGRPPVGLFDRPTGEPDPGPEAITVSQACALAREVMEDNFALVLIQGEISRFLHHGSGHMYFQLKDSSATLSVAMFKGNNRRLKFRPEDGMDVLVSGRLSIYGARASNAKMRCGAVNGSPAKRSFNSRFRSRSNASTASAGRLAPTPALARMRPRHASWL